MRWTMRMTPTTRTLPCPSTKRRPTHGLYTYRGLSHRMWAERQVMMTRQVMTTVMGTVIKMMKLRMRLKLRVRLPGASLRRERHRRG
ncbi:hypothetical protein DPMN_178097 [Dreissena polymorpha]|uniref:Uncharacterized protein n=1 Tax=Dreissena polymorpha TaxID=45954 RepID=A0A9D4EDG3_DREPO|nr:hypothetical protein DPMN_178097 [Dreissena polymorpha]